ncbi:TonB-dependent receptor [Lutibacter sp. A80]|uniref:TonB-dependent receptor plug domain-containing protein n=1 Tax=Lutibacter sp. A80 TaxID=2918453 RepID=UPI001F0520EF|nr:TonB-dependent receptor [Lutibacter sp. A80]UMB60534.1 TonB-dependent receptor [Lutibacter sp. A80]
MKIKITLIIFTLLYIVQLKAQEETIRRDTLKEIIITSNRISLPFSENSRTITLITSEDIIKSAASNVADLLQNIAGLDIRRRGVDGMQSDLYIRGGNFDQTLVLIDGVKMDDPQTGHHSMNAILSLDNIERIEVIKGPAARVYGQNAFTGAINIVTKKIKENNLKVNLGYGSYQNIKGGITFTQKFDNGGIFTALNYQESEGYRYNTDFKNKSIFVKANLGSYNLTSSYTERDFGANGFYASPAAIDQYEETQTSLVAIDANYTIKNITIKPRVYWKRNQDLYLYLRHDPPVYRNLHISNKIGAETNAVLNSSLGKTGIGLDVSRVFLVSNNLQDHARTVITGFLEHRFEINNFDITPGIAISSYSDFNTKAFPGIDVGYRFSERLKMYSNIGYTYRVPTFTDLYYIGSNEIGNPDLKPESALSEELGFKYNTRNLDINVAFFNRTADDLIDWAKDNPEDPDEKWEARNFSEVTTKGFEIDFGYRFQLWDLEQRFNLGYSFIEDENKDEYTRYALNSIKHQLTSGIDFKFSKLFSQNISYRFVERSRGETYTVVDAKIKTELPNRIGVFLSANNIFNTTYTETNLVPMPKGNIMLGINYKIY